MQLRVHEVVGEPGTLLLDCQSEFYSNLKTRFVIPMVEVERAPKPLPRINPIVTFAGKVYVLLTNQAGTMPVAQIGRALGSLAGERYTVTRAIDALLSGV